MSTETDFAAMETAENPQRADTPSRYFYHRRKGACRSIDGTGVECMNVSEAAALAYVEMLKWTEVSPQRLGRPRTVEVMDERGRMILRLPATAVFAAIS